MGYFYIFLTVIFTVYGQIVLKWRLNQMEVLPDGFTVKFIFLFKAIFDPYIFSSFFAAFLASLTWMAALKEFELSRAYPFMSLSFVCVLFLSYFFFRETINVQKIIGTILIVLGIIIVSKSS